MERSRTGNQISSAQVIAVLLILGGRKSKETFSVAFYHPSLVSFILMTGTLKKQISASESMVMLHTLPAILRNNVERPYLFVPPL